MKIRDLKKEKKKKNISNVLKRIKGKGSKCGDRFVFRTLTFLVNC